MPRAPLIDANATSNVPTHVSLSPAAPDLGSGKLAYSVPELCLATSLGRSSIYEEIRRGRLRVTKVGARTVIRREDAIAWLQSLS
jgi:excisionase family DNA binding protein